MFTSTRGKKRLASQAPMLTLASKKRLTQAEKDLLDAEMQIAQAIIPRRNLPIASGSPSGLFNISLGGKENKFVDVTNGTGDTPANQKIVNTSSSTTIILLNGLKLGTAAFNRIGNKISMKSLYWSLNYGLKGVDADPGTDTENYTVPVRAMIVYDKQANGAAPVIGDLLSAFTGVDNSTARPIDTNSPNNLNNRERFIVVMDKRFILSTGGASGRHIKKFKRLNTSVAYKSGATVGDVTDITSGALYFITYRDADFAGALATDGTFAVNMSMDIRLRFQDE